MRCLCLPLLIAALPASSLAQPLTWGELLAPDRLLRSGVQSALLGLRSQVDLRWADMAVDARRGTVILREIALYPTFPHDIEGTCAVFARSAKIQFLDFDRPEQVRVDLGLSDVSVDLGCLPPAAAMPFRMMQMDHVRSPLVRVDFTYDIPSSEGKLGLFAEVEDAASLTANADFDYLWFRVDPLYPEGAPIPVIDLDSARIEIENLGLWSVISPLMPRPLTNPETAGAIVAAMIVDALSGPLPRPEVMDVAAEAAETWSAFLSDPQLLTVGTSNADPIWLDINAYVTDPTLLLVDLKPRFSSRAGAMEGLIPASVLKAVFDEPDSVSAAQLADVAMALAAGKGLPRNPALAIELLANRSPEDPAARMSLAEVLAPLDPAAAYEAALSAGLEGEPAASLLDRIESDLTLGDIIDIQMAIPSGGDFQANSVGDLRRAAFRFASGEGVGRSYREALLHARLAEALGDAASADLAAGIEARFGDAEAWQTLDAEVSDAAIDLWIGLDMPARVLAHP